MVAADSAMTIVAALESVTHAESASVVSTTVSHTPVASVIPAASAVAVPCVTSAIGQVEVRASEVEECAVRIAGIDAKVPESCVPVERAIEVSGSAIGAILPVEQNIAQVHVASLPVKSVEVGLVLNTHQIVEIDFVGGLILVVCQIELVGHLVGEEEGLFASLLITHGVSLNCHCEYGCEGDDELLHSCIFFRLLIIRFSFSRWQR